MFEWGKPYKVDLDRRIERTDLDTLFATGDSKAHSFNIEIERSGVPVTIPNISGVVGYFIQHSADPEEEDTTIPLKGSKSGNVASLTLDKACYTEPVQFSLIIKVTHSDEISTIFHGAGSVLCSRTDKINDAANVVKDLDTLLAQIAAIEEATADGIAAAQEARDAGAQAVEDAQAAGAAAKATADAAAADALAAAESVRSMYYKKADAIIDDSPRAAVHELYAQGDHPLAVTLYGAGDEETGGGVSKATVHAGGRNLFDIGKINAENTVSGNSFDVTRTGYCCCIYSTKIGTDTKIVDANGAPMPGIKNMPYLAAGTYRLTAKVTVTASDTQSTSQTLHVGTVDDDGTYKRLVAIADPASGGTFTLTKPARITIRRYTNADATISNLMLSAGAGAVPFAAYNAAAVELPLLPDDTPLLADGLAENWFASGCDKAITLDGSEDWKVMDFTASYPAFVYFIAFADSAKSPVFYTQSYRVIDKAYSYMREHPGCFRVLAGNENRIAFAADAALYPTIADWKAWLAANPQTVYYRSKEYAPGNELRLTHIVRGDREYGAAGVPLYKPAALTAVTVTGSGDTAVSYAHDTKHYIDQKFAALSAAMIGG